MSFDFIKNMSGGQEIVEEIPMAAVSVTAGDYLYNVAGYLSNATPTNARTNTAVGIAYESIDNSGGSVGTYSIQTNAAHDAVYEVGTDSTLDQTLVWTSVPLVLTTTIDEDNAATDATAVAQIRKMVSASKAQVKLNFHPPA